MKLRLKVLIIFACMWAMISLIIYFYSYSHLMHDYLALERKQVVDDIQRTKRAMYTIFTSLNILNNDWAQWNDSYQFMQDKNKAFIKSNLAFTTFENAKINLILFFDASGKLYYGADYDLQTKKFVPLPTDLINRIEAEKTFTTHVATTSKKVGFLTTPKGYLVLSSQPMLTSEGKGPIRGSLVMGYFFNEKHLQELSDIVRIQIHLYPLPISANDKILNEVYQNLQKGIPYCILASSKDLISGYTFITNIDGNPIGILQIQIPRDIYKAGILTINHYLFIVIGTGILFLIAIWFLLQIFVLDRIISVSKQVIDINRESKFSNRIEIWGRDELGNMVNAVNSLMEIIELTQEQLKYRIFLRTEELDRLSKLNKNLYSEMTRQHEVEAKLREGEKVLRHMAYYDILTGLPNRFFFYEILKKILAKAEREGTGIVLLFIDADKFKSINDRFGHDIGDKFLKYIAEQLKNSINESDVVARLAGDEFILFLTNIRGKTFINRTIEQILYHISKPITIDGLELYSTFSVGISIYPEDGITVEDLEKHADLAMYYAKRQPGNSYCYFDEIKQKTFYT